MRTVYRNRARQQGGIGSFSAISGATFWLLRFCYAGNFTRKLSLVIMEERFMGKNNKAILHILWQKHLRQKN